MGRWLMKWFSRKPQPTTPQDRKAHFDAYRVQRQEEPEPPFVSTSGESLEDIVIEPPDGIATITQDYPGMPEWFAAAREAVSRWSPLPPHLRNYETYRQAIDRHFLSE